MITTTHWPRLLLGLLLAGGLAACDNKNKSDDGGTPTVSLVAAPNALTLGATTGLIWSSTNATACTASGGWTGSRITFGSEANTPTAVGTVSYTLTCTGAAGSATATTTVTVTAPPPPTVPTVSLAAAPTSLTLGAATTLTWSSTNATACTASGGWTGSRATSGSEANTPAAAGTSSYTLTCTGPGGSANATATVTTNPPPVPTVSLNAAPTSIAIGSPTTLTWSSTDATACTATGAWTGSRATSGSEANTPAAAGTSSYTLTCTGAGGSANATATVTVNPLPTVTISAAPTTVTLGAASTLSWSSTNATACTASGGWSGSRATSGTASVTPAATGSIPYTLTCTGPGGSANGTATVTVNPVPSVTLNAAPTTITLGSTTTLTWSSSNTTACTASGAWAGTRTVSGAATVTPAAIGETRYTLACTGSGGTATATAVVQVNAVSTVSVTFEGKLTSAGDSGGGPAADGEIAGAAIQVLVNGDEFTGTTDIDGNYSVTASVPAAVAADVAVLLIGRRALPSGLEIYFLSQLGSFEQARVRAGADGSLTADEEFRVNITPFTTAELSLEQELLRGVIDLGISGTPGFAAVSAGKRVAPSARPMQPANLDTPLDRYVEELRMSIDYAQALGAATITSLVVDRGIPAPFGFVDTFSLSFYRDARLFFIEDQQLNNALAYEAALADTLANRDTTRGISVAEVPAQAITAVVGDVNEEALIGNGGSSFLATSFTFDPSGSGAYSTYEYSTDDMNWAVNGSGVIEVRFGTAPSSTYGVGFVDEDGNFISGSCTISNPEVDIQPIGSTIARQRMRTVQRCSAGFESSDFTFDSFATVLFTSPSALPRNTREDYAGRAFAFEVPTLGTAVFNNDPVGLQGDVANFSADGTGGTGLTSLSFTWQVNTDGALVMQYSNGASSTLRMLRPLFDGGSLMLMVHTGPSGRYTIGRPIFAINDGLQFTPTSVVGVHYQHGVGAIANIETVDRSRPATLAETSLLKGFAIELFASGIGNYLNDRLITDGSGAVVRSAPESADFNTGTVWGLREDGSLLIRRYFTLSGGDPSICTLYTTNPDCYISDDREVFPIFLHGDRQGWLERRIFNESFEVGPIVGTPSLLVRTYTQAPNGDFAFPRTSPFAPVRSSPQTVRPPLRPDVAQRVAQERALKSATARGDRRAARRIEKQQRALH